MQAQQLEVVAAHDLRVFIFRVVVPRDAHAGLIRGCDSGEVLSAIAEVSIHWIGEVVVEFTAKDPAVPVEGTSPLESH